LRRGREKRGIGLMAEYKRASPSLGDIDLQTSPEEAAEAFRGADCLSVLTERDYFKGDLSYIERAKAFGGPILRKDFIYHPSQVAETAASAASALLLIVSLTPDLSLLSELISLAADFGLEAVTEIFSLSELEAAREAKASIIQVNARNLGDLSVDPDRALSLIKSAEPSNNETWIAASGLNTYDDLRRAASLGYHGALVGTALMRAKDKRAALASLISPPPGAPSGATPGASPGASPGAPPNPPLDPPYLKGAAREDE
jgi:indole-3-glycerol phosphate synthase